MSKTPSAHSASALPPWSGLVTNSHDGWKWVERRYVSVTAIEQPVSGPKTNALKRFMVKHVYATHNNSKSVQAALHALLKTLPADGWGLNFGAGATRLHPCMINLDVIDHLDIDILSDGEVIPLKDNSIDLVISQEVIEHIEDPHQAIAEVHRILKPGGKCYCQAPFVIGYHPGPTDFWRFSRQAWPALFPAHQWALETLEISVGHGTGFYRIAIEFCAVTASVIHNQLYQPVKGLAALCLLPLKLFDRLSPKGQARERIPGGYFCIARKL